jgi:hypothetical protein
MPQMIHAVQAHISKTLAHCTAKVTATAGVLPLWEDVYPRFVLPVGTIPQPHVLPAAWPTPAALVDSSYESRCLQAQPLSSQ